MNDIKVIERSRNPGYKQTEVGLIPEDWEVRYFDEIGETFIGLTYSPSDVSDSGKLVHRSSNIQDNKLSFEDNVFVSAQVPEKLILRENDILICVRNGSKRLIGKSALIKGRSVGETFGAFMSVFRPKDYAPIIYQYFISNIVQSQISASLGATINQITNKTLKEFKTPLPPTLAEQKAIATALSDVDELISSLDVLIAKKKAIKQGAMQQLLTPPTSTSLSSRGKNQAKESERSRRLDGFDGEWVERNLGEFVSFQVGFPFASQYFNEDNKGLRLVKNRDLKTDNRLIFYSGHYLEEYIVKNGDILIGMDGDFLPCLWSKGKALLNQRVGRLIKKRSISLMFLFYYLKKYLNEIENRTSATTVKHLSHSDVENMKLALPEVKEQKAIAQILSDMDQELEELATKKEKYEHIKQGMMQELLTGNTRLV